MSNWKITVELDNDVNNFESCIIEASDKDKANKRAQKYFTKKMKATNVKIIHIEEVEG